MMGKIGLDVFKESSDLYTFQGRHYESKLLSLPALQGLPEGAWRTLWDALNMMRSKLIGHRIEAHVKSDSVSSMQTLVKVSTSFYLGPVNHKANPFALVRMGTVTTYEMMSLGNVEVVNLLLDDMRCEAWQVWHALCIVDRVILAEQENKRLIYPRKKKLTNLAAFNKIEGWLTYEHMRR